METITQYHETAAALIARVFLGSLFLFQGYDAIFNVKVKNIILAYENQFANKGIPRQLTVLGSWFTSYAELIGGICLVLGLFEYPALYLLGFNVLLASVAFGISSSMWDTRFVFPRVVLIIFLLIIPESWNCWSLDHFIKQFN